MVSIFDLIMYIYTNEHELVAALYMLSVGICVVLYVTLAVLRKKGLNFTLAATYLILTLLNVIGHLDFCT